VDEEQVDVVQAEPVEGCVEPGDRPVLALVPPSSFVVTKSSSRGTALSRMPRPTPVSLPYFAAVSM
jgi:hypothetical protein